jgi:aminoglycoside phosphotransferase (APT) family kinase protein
VITAASQAYEAARGFAHFTNALLDLSPTLIQDTLPDFKNHASRLVQFENALLENTADRTKACLPEIEFIKKQIPWLHELNKSLSSLPRRIVHLDTKLNNVLIDANTLRAKCVIDLDTVMEGYLFDDFGDMVRTACNPCAEDEPDTSKIQFDHTIYNALRKGYLEILTQHLTTQEIDTLYIGTKVVIWVQAMRFLTDYLNGDIYYKTKYDNHNLVRTRGQIALLKTMF